MALTQTATIPGPGPSWDEEVVPALRKRLESESRTIARRISAISVTSADEPPSMAYGNDYAHGGAYQSAPAPARPRPSQSRTGSDGPPRVAKSPSTRSRTHSQPWPNNGKPNGSAVSRQDPRPTRIPKPSRSRAGSTSSHNYSPSISSVGPYSSSPRTPHVETDLFVLREKSAAASQSTISVHGAPDSGLLHEPAPFRKEASVASFNEHNADPPRPSVDSEERPYEHWYRGDVSRNGGVGELKVAKRQEMLEIANYGHTLRTKQLAQNPIPVALDTGRRRRRRADSVGPTNRQSFYMEDDDAVGLVKDENPLTDLEGDGSDFTSDYQTPNHSYHEDNSSASASTPGLASYNARSSTPTAPRSASRQQQSRLPTPTRQLSETPRSAPPPRAGSEPPPRAGSEPPPPSSSKRAASPQAASPSAPKKSRNQAAKATRAKTEAARRVREDDTNRRSVAQYPSTNTGEDMMHAIPSWTQPVPRQGNWDDVVLPVVARKKGLDGHYEQADGSPRARQADSAIAPAPGTFGYDHSKYRPPRDDDDDGGIPMDEFGRHHAPRDEEEQERPLPGTFQSAHDRTPLPVHPNPHPDPNSHLPHPNPYPNSHLPQPNTNGHPQPPPSPVPFSHYAPPAGGGGGGGRLEVQHEKGNGEGNGGEGEEEKGGCCGCVVM